MKNFENREWPCIKAKVGNKPFKLVVEGSPIGSCASITLSWSAERSFPFPGQLGERYKMVPLKMKFTTEWA
eukprot:1145809-Pelagomonas_calceolata.AAC.5